MDRDRNESQEASEDRVERPGPFGVREEWPSGGPSVGDMTDRSGGPDDRIQDDHGTPSAGADPKGSQFPSEDGPRKDDSSRSAEGPKATAGLDSPRPGITSPDPGGADRERIVLRERIVEAMKTVYDPEIPVNIYDLGMVYEIEVHPDHSVLVTMTLTSPACPVAGTLPGEVEEKVNEVEGVRGGKVELVWDPPWTPERMSESAKLELGMF